MDTEEYIKDRLDPQITWYDEKSTTNKRLHITCRILEIVCAATIPFLAGFAKNGGMCFPIAIGLLGVVIVICVGIASLFQFQEHWIKYRTTAESLKKEKYLYLTNSEPYDTKTPLPILVQRTESLVSQENTNWAQYMTKPTKGDNHV